MRCRQLDHFAEWTLGRVLRHECVELEIGVSLGAGESLDHLVDSYRVSQGGHRGEKKNAKRGARTRQNRRTLRGVFYVEFLGKIKFIQVSTKLSGRLLSNTKTLLITKKLQPHESFSGDCWMFAGLKRAS